MDLTGIIHAVRSYNGRAAVAERPAEVHEKVLKEKAELLKAEGERRLMDSLCPM